MEIATEWKDNTCILKPYGRIDTLTSGELEQAVNEVCEKCEKLILDMSAVDYVSSAGIRVIIMAHQTAGADSFVLRSVQPNIMQLLTMTGFHKVLNFED